MKKTIDAHLNGHEPLKASGKIRLCALAVMCSITGLASGVTAAQELPVFKLQTPVVDEQKAVALLKHLQGNKPSGFKVSEINRAVNYEDGVHTVQVYTASGGHFVADRAQLWNADAKPVLPEPEQALKLANAFTGKFNLLPKENGWIKTSFAGYSETGVGADVAKGIDKRILDIHANYAVEIKLEKYGLKNVPVVGGGGDFKVAIGDRGEVVGYTGAWRQIADVVDVVKITDRKTALANFVKEADGAKISNLQSKLAYYSAPGFEAQQVMAPVWVISGEMDVNGERVPMRTSIVAATEYGPVWKQEDVKPRTTPKHRDVPNRLKLSSTHGQVDRQDDQGINTDGFTGHLRWLAHEMFGFRSANADGAEAGTSWIGTSQGLSGSQGNAAGFMSGLAIAGYSLNFNWGDASAWESDWRSNDGNYVDAADFVYYTGHANQNGWVLNVPDDTFLNFTEVQSGGSDFYGNGDLEWIIIAACGPHQSTHFMGNTTNAFDRWRGIFDGLHQFLGYGAVTYDNTTEGARVTELARSGVDIIDAWFQTAWEVQPTTNTFNAPNGPTIFVTAMWANTPGNSKRNDEIWGSFGNDPKGSSQTRNLMWSGT